MDGDLEACQGKPGAMENSAVARSITALNLVGPNGEVVPINIMATPHDSPEDTDFILKQLNGVAPNHTLFVEQGSPNQPDHVVSQLRRIAAANPLIQDDFSRRSRRNTWSIMADQNSSPFAVASNYFASRGGAIVNMDLSARVDGIALDFITQMSSVEFALECAYDEVRDACFDYKKTIPLILQLLFPQIPMDKVNHACEKLYHTYGNARNYLNRSNTTHDYWYYLREKFMREVLEQQAKAEDVALCHPNHAKKIRIEKKDWVVPAIPEKLFEF